jgi:hypothetical protein
LRSSEADVQEVNSPPAGTGRFALRESVVWVWLEWMMKAEELAESAAADMSPPAGLSVALEAMWHARAGNWDKAHDLCQEVVGKDGSWIHAWLHRQEGDLGNAGYWYARAGREMPGTGVPLEEEWMAITRVLLG